MISSGDRLRTLRIQRGLTQAELAQKSSISRSTIYKCEKEGLGNRSPKNL